MPNNVFVRFEGIGTACIVGAIDDYAGLSFPEF